MNVLNFNQATEEYILQQRKKLNELTTKLKKYKGKRVKIQIEREQQRYVFIGSCVGISIVGYSPDITPVFSGYLVASDLSSEPETKLVFTDTASFSNLSDEHFFESEKTDLELACAYLCELEKLNLAKNAEENNNESLYQELD
jgi:hypothetical protein